MSTIQPRAPMTHDLKCWPGPFQAVLDGCKPFEWRKADRDYRVGDTLRLREWQPLDPANGVGWATAGHYTGRATAATVTYILHGPGYGIPDGYCIMGIKVPEPNSEETILAALAINPKPVPADSLINLLGRIVIARWFDAGWVEWQGESTDTSPGAYAITELGRAAAGYPERRPERA